MLIRRGGMLSLVAPHSAGRRHLPRHATVHPSGSVNIEPVSKKLASRTPKERRRAGCPLELVSQGNFVTYDPGVSLQGMAKPAAALAHVPIS